MKFRDLVQIVIASTLSANKIRSALTMLGVTIGVILIVGGTAVLQSFIEKNVHDMEMMGGSEFWIVSKEKERAFIGIELGTLTSEITDSDIRELKKQCQLIKALAPISQGIAKVRIGESEILFTIRGTTPTYVLTRDAKMVKGRFFTDSEMLLGSRVCVIEKSKNTDQIIDENIINKKIIVNGYSFKIVGFLETPAEQTSPGQTFLLYVPLSTLRKTFGIRGNNIVIGKAVNAANVIGASEQVEKVLLQRYGYPLRFSVLNFGKLLEQVKELRGKGEKMLFVLAMLSLLAGGIGVMNIMYVSMLERIREIGLVKALGAKKRHIMSQFLLEAIFICLIGGIIGIFIGVTSSYIITLLMGLEYKIPFWTLIAGFVLPVIVGVVSGYYPAKTAADLDPIEALRYE